jgi:cytochrome c oxidase assembly protein subunit 15
MQLIYGALMAGHKAATAAPTWPQINGSFLPAGMFSSSSGVLDLIENKITIHFIHRSLAFLLFLSLLLWSWKASKTKTPGLFSKTKWWPLIFVVIQAVLGIVSVLTSVKIIPNHWGMFEWLALLHQAVAMFLLLSLVWMAYLIKSK